MKKYVFLVVTFFISAALFGEGEELLSHQPGRYAESIRLKLPAGSVYSIEESDDQRPVRYSIPLLLSALDGESRTYTINVAFPGSRNDETERYIYIIDRKEPLPPKVSVEEGVYYDEIALTFQYNPREEIYYSVQTEESTEYAKWEGEPVILSGKEGYIVTYRLEVHAIDDVGNRSLPASYTYVVNKVVNDPNHYLDIISPIEGTFYNKQLLACKHSGLSWIRYSLDGENPVTGGQDYTKPVLIDRTGKVLLRIAGYAEHSKRIIEKRVEFTVAANKKPALSLQSGIITESRSVEYIGDKPYHTTLDDTKPDRYDTSDFSVLVLEPKKNMRYPVIIRLAESDPEDSGEFRYTYILDDWTPAPPQIIAFPSQDRRRYSVAILGERGARIYYSIDGETPDTESIIYDGVFEIPAPDLDAESSVTVKAVAVSDTGTVSAVEDRELRFFFRQLSPPVLNVENGNRITFDPDLEYTIVYETSYNPLTLAVPGIGSSRVSGDIDFSVPYGMEEEVYLQAAVYDEYGNVSNPSKIVQIRVDNHPPPPPEIRFLDGVVRISGGNGSNIFYSVRTIADGVTLSREEDAVYEKPFFLYGEEEKKTEYSITAYSVDTAGNRSRNSEPLSFVIDERSAKEPLVSGVEEGGIYNGPVTIRFTNPYPDQKILYEIQKDGNEPDLNRDSAAADDGFLHFPGIEGDVEAYTLYYAPYLESSDSLGQSRNISFTIDMEYPPSPLITGIDNGSLHSDDVVLTNENPPEQGTAYYSVGTGGSLPPDCFGNEGRKLISPLKIGGEKGKEIHYSLMFGAVDDAGNKTYAEQFLNFTIDKKAPDPPEPDIRPIEGSAGEFHLHFPIIDETVYYEFASGNELPKLPGEGSPVYNPENPVLVKGSPGEEAVYHLQAKSIDPAGNWSMTSPVYTFTIDRMKPRVVNGPIYRTLEAGRLEINWDYLREASVFYALDDSDWKKYEQPLTVSTRSVRTLHYYYEDDAGNRSDVFKTELPVYKTDVEVDSFLAGVENGKFYADGVELRLKTDNYICRYETAYREKYIQDITQFSPVMPGTIRFDVFPGETREFYINAQLFDPATNLPVSEQESISFTIDKLKPAVPSIDVEDIAYFQDEVTIPISHEEGSLFYSIIRYDAYGNEIERIEDKPYSGPLQLDIPKGEYSKFTVSAFTVDKVGNKSARVSVSDLVIDKKIIYVSRLGNDLYEGSRMKPFRSIERGIEFAKETGRNIIYISGGQFEVEESLDFDEELLLYGGYDPFNWTQSDPGGTVISVGRHFERGDAIAIVSAESIFFQGLTFVSTQYDPVPIRVTGGELTGDGITLMNLEEDNSPLIDQRGGKVALRNSLIQSFSREIPELIRCTNGELLIRNTSVQNKERHWGTLSLIRAVDSPSVSIESSVLIGGRASDSSLLRLSGTDLKITDSVLTTGIEGSRAAAVIADSSEISLDDSSITCAPSTRINTGISVKDDSVLSIHGSEMYLNSRTGGIGIKAADSQVTVADSFINGINGTEFLYPLQFKRVESFVYNNFISVATEGDFIGCDLDGGNAGIFNNTFIFSESSPNSFGVRVNECDSLYLINNILIDRSRLSEGTAVSIDGEEELQIVANNIHGWKTYLKGNSRSYNTSEEVNAADGNRRGGEYHKNISESFTNAFLITKTEAPYYLKQSSLCVNGGVDVSEMGGPAVDFEGDPRPNPEEGLKPAYDIGADEY